MAARERQLSVQVERVLDHVRTLQRDYGTELHSCAPEAETALAEAEAALTAVLAFALAASRE
jgi:hypothetical protein